MRSSRSVRTAAIRSVAQPPELTLDEREYPQVALTLCLRHSRPHHDTSTEFHTPAGPFTLVPLPGDRSSLVWVLDPKASEELAAIDDAELSDEIERASYSIFGKIEVESGPRPLSAPRCDRTAVRRQSASRSSAKLRMSFRRSARKVSIWVCATLQQSASLRSWQIEAAKILELTICSRTTIACGAPM